MSDGLASQAPTVYRLEAADTFDSTRLRVGEWAGNRLTAVRNQALHLFKAYAGLVLSLTAVVANMPKSIYLGEDQVFTELAGTLVVQLDTTIKNNIKCNRERCGWNENVSDRLYTAFPQV